MGASQGIDNLGIKNASSSDVKSVHKKLAELYSRRTAVERLIQCLESYAECQTKNGRRERLKLTNA